MKKHESAECPGNKDASLKLFSVCKIHKVQTIGRKCSGKDRRYAEKTAPIVSHASEGAVLI